MSTEMPPIEARVSAQEHMTTILHARIEELSQDMEGSFKHLDAYLVGFEQKVDARFDAVDVRFDKVEADTVEVRADIAEVKTDIAGIKTDVAEVKSGMATMESRILNAFQQLVTIIDTRLPPAIDR